MIAAIDDQSLDSPDSAIGGMDVIAAAHLHLAHRYTVIDGRLGTSIHGRLGTAAHAHAA
jgi:hypothetical protein